MNEVRVVELEVMVLESELFFSAASLVRNSWVNTGGFPVIPFKVLFHSAQSESRCCSLEWLTKWNSTPINLIN